MPANPDQIDLPRRDFLFLATIAFGAVGCGAAAWPFIAQLAPNAQTRALSTTEIDIAPIQRGQIIHLLHQGKPLFVRNRTDAEIAALRATPLADLIDPQRDEDRVKPGHDAWLICWGSCTHLGCVLLDRQGAFGGWFCPCHGSVYDASGRVRRGPAPSNLPIPAYTFLSDSKIRVG